VTQWQATELVTVNALSGTLIYPFSGPDFLNAYTFFPSKKEYVLMSLEVHGYLPNFKSMPDQNTSDLLADVRASLSDLFLRHYFITKAMMRDLRTPYLKGNVSLFFLMMALTDNRIVSLDYIQMNPDGAIGPRRKAPKGPDGKPLYRPIEGLRIVFQNEKASAPQTLTYWCVDISDAGLARKPEFVKYYKSLNPGVTFIKSASYLPHDSGFKTVRQLILDTSAGVLQDDTGVPYHYYKEGGWDMALYGQYSKPIKDFKFGYQKDMKEAFDAPGAAKPLPFKYGYHWRDGTCSVIVARRK